MSLAALAYIKKLSTIAISPNLEVPAAPVLAPTGGTAVLAGASWVTERARQVSINRQAIDGLAKEILSLEKGHPYCPKAAWHAHALQPLLERDAAEGTATAPLLSDQWAAQWIFVIDCLNFCFWDDRLEDGIESETEAYGIDFGGKTWTGYWGMVAAINRRLVSGDHSILTSEWLSSCTERDLQELFDPNTGRMDPNGKQRCPIPVLRERVLVLNEAGTWLARSSANGLFADVIVEGGESAARLVDRVAQEMISFRDVHTYQRRIIPILKRAQILASDIWSCFGGEGLGSFIDMDTLTMFADYRVPQCLAALGVIEYGEELLDRLKRRSPLPSGSELEMEIRCASIFAVECVRRRCLEMVREKGQGPAHVNAITIDFHLWDYAKSHQQAISSVPIHRTRSIYY
eukprot:Clim_evm14s249 gene=Clim_evmTU14s249